MSEAAVKVVGFLLRTAIGVLIVLELVLALGILLQAMDANPDASFTDWAYRNQDRVMRPFDGMFDDVSLGDGSDAVFDVSGIFAMAAYGCLFIPLGLALSRVGRRLDDFDVERQEAAETARQARLFGKEPPPDPEPQRRRRRRPSVTGCAAASRRRTDCNQLGTGFVIEELLTAPQDPGRTRRRQASRRDPDEAGRSDRTQGHTARPVTAPPPGRRCC